MAKKARKRITFFIKGIAVWPKLDVPDVFVDKKGKAGEPHYLTNLKLEDGKIEALEKYLLKIASEDDETSDIAPGKLTLPIKTDKKDKELRTVVVKSTKKPPMFDARNNKLPADVVVGGGSLLNVSVAANCYSGFGGGVNLYIDAVQVLKLEESTYGKSPFEETEGYAYEGNVGEPESPFEDDGGGNETSDEVGEDAYKF
jgi:hypothetical protein